MEKKRYGAPESRFANLCGRSGTEKHAAEKSSRLQHLSIVVGLRPKNRALSFAISRTRQAALLWGLRLAVEHKRREPHQRKSVLDSHLRWKSRKGSSA